VTVPGYGDPEVVVQECRLDLDTGECMPWDVVDRRPLVSRTFGGGFPDPEAVLEDFGWRVLPDDLPEGGWDTADYGGVALVEPIDI
jgi:hypothetical protein